ncbi:nuclear transport factor 2 family protein [Echinicola salinicaeni]|uniref:nuclear transport factor 2 family protein n=1 Tax=Echinicola salinicaeni TaxID=2762757 RepID=UPI00164417EF|nr:nuclear transport factor 2 family protein [Echinicola salinicaeni]
MKSLALIFSFLWASCHFSQAQSETSIELVNAVQKLTETMISPDKAKLKILTDKKLSYGHSNGKIENQEKFIESLLSGASDFISMDLQNQNYEVVDNIGIARHTLLAETNDGGVPGKVKIGIMMVWRYDNDQWKLLVRQAYKLPPAQP